MTAAPLLAALGRASLEGVVLVLLVAAVVRALPRLPAAARCALWWLASARLVLALVALPWAPALPVTLPDRPDALDRPVEIVRRAPEAIVRVAPAAIAPVAAASLAQVASVAEANVPWGASFAALWALGALATIALRVRAARRLARTWREAIALESPAVAVWLREWLGSSRAAKADVRVSADVLTPLVLAGARPRLLLPARALELDDASLRLVLAHETSHLRRGDLVWSVVPALVECAFWFHPFARWAATEYTQAREEACDADALRLCDAAPRRYGELLVEFGIEPGRHGALAAPFGSSHADHLKRRISMLASIRALTPAQRLVAAAALAFVGGLALFPARLVGADACGEDTAVIAAASSGRGSAVAGAPRRESSRPRELRGFAVGSRVKDGVIMSGEFDTRSLRVLDRFQDEVDPPAALFLMDGAGWITREPEVLEQVRAGLDRTRATQDELEALSGQIGRMGRMIGRLSEQQVVLEQQRDEAEDALDRVRDELDASDLAESRRARLERDAAKLASQLATLEAEVAAIEDQARSLEEQQSALESPQEEALTRHEAAQRTDMLRMRAMADRLKAEGRLQRLGR